jgi:folate-binding protein YgfZ
MTDAFDARLRSDGAMFERVAGLDLPSRFAGDDTEWAAVRQRCGVFDARFRSLLRLMGADRVTFLQGMVSNDVVRLEPGSGTYAAFLTQQGRVVADLRIYALPEELWLDTPAQCAPTLRAGLERYIIADDVEFAEPTLAPLIAVEGPLAARTLLGLLGESLEGMELYGHRDVIFDGTHVRVVAATHTGESGYLVFGEPGTTAQLWERCRAAGAEPVGMAALDVLRIEAGIPWYGRDMDESTLISEVGLEEAVSYRKGCYLGQEVVERVAARGQVQKRLVGLLCAGTEIPSPRASLMYDGKEVGRVTSATWSPAKRSVIALGFARREVWTPGTELTLMTPVGPVPAGVVELPFYTHG